MNHLNVNINQAIRIQSQCLISRNRMVMCVLTLLMLTSP